MFLGDIIFGLKSLGYLTAVLHLSLGINVLEIFSYQTILIRMYGMRSWNWERFENGNNMEDDIDDPDLLDDTIQCPRPPTTPNVPIEDETICPVCSQKGNRKILLP